MKILVLSSFFPYPLFSGGQVRLYNILTNLSKKHEITLVCEIRRNEDLKNLSKIKKYCKRVKTAVRARQWSIKNILKTGFSFYPFLLTGHTNTKLQEILKEELAKENYDLVDVETFYVMQNLPKTKVPVILTEYNIEYQVYEAWVKSFWLFLLKPLFYLDILKMKYWEKRFWKKADKVITVSYTDRQTVEKVTGKTVEVVPNGVDFKYFSRIPKVEPKTKTVAFVGSFRWLQNKDAVKYLLANLWPEIKKNIAGVKLLIVGNRAHKYLGELIDPQIEVADSVSDIRKVYSRSTLLLAPLQIGGGTKFKILESMASGLPIVTTPMGIEGLSSTNGILIGKTDEELIAHVEYLLKNENVRKEISQKEKEFVKNNFDWKEISAKLEKIYENWR
ncbi:glycosyltransferase family 4 protein [Candidatus Gottesmanbacteria bacterium]|nr:glycosyltransferase family 4 protein [Candidatus Gottesmanbacteria bacterium]